MHAKMAIQGQQPAAMQPSKPPLSIWGRLVQLYKSQWKGQMWDIVPEPAPDHSTKTPHHVVCVKTQGAIISRYGQEDVELEYMEWEGEGRTKKDANNAAAAKALDWLTQHGYWDPANPDQYKAKDKGVGRDDKFRVHNKVQDPDNPKVYLDVAIGSDYVGRVVFELYRHKVPRAANNFLWLCRGGMSRVAVDPSDPQRPCRVEGLSYRGAPFHRMKINTGVQGGDVLNKDGSGGYSIYGPSFEFEESDLTHNRAFLLTTAVGFEDTHTSQFIVLTAPMASLNTTNIVFGQVLRGFGVIKELESRPTDPSNRPLEPCTIVSCGELPPGADLDDVQPLMLGSWPLWAQDQGPPPDKEVNEAVFRAQVAEEIREAGNALFKQGDYRGAALRYAQGLRYLVFTTFKTLDRAGNLPGWNYELQVPLTDAEVKLHCNRASCLVHLGEARKALEELHEALRLRPHHAKGLYLKGRAHLALGDHELEGAVDAFAAAARAAPQDAAVRAALTSTKERLQLLRRAQKQRFAAAFQKGLLHMPADDQVEEYDYYLGDMGDEEEVVGDTAGDAGAPAGDTLQAVASNGAAGKPASSSMPSSSSTDSQAAKRLPLKPPQDLPGDNLFAAPSQFVSAHPQELAATMGWNAEELYKDPLGLFTGRKKPVTGGQAPAAPGAAAAGETASVGQHEAPQHAPEDHKQQQAASSIGAAAGSSTFAGTSNSNGMSSLNANQIKQQQQRRVSFQASQQEGDDLPSDESETWGRCAVAGAPWGEDDREGLQELSPAEVTAVTVPVTDPWYVEHSWGQAEAGASPAAAAARQVAGGSSSAGALQGDHHNGTSAAAASSSQANGDAAASSSSGMAPAASHQQQAASSSTSTPAAASQDKGPQQPLGGPPLPLQQVQAAVLQAARAAGDMAEEEAAEVLRPASPRSMAKQLGAWFNVSAVKRQH